MSAQEAAINCLLGYRVDRYPAEPFNVIRALGFGTRGYASLQAHRLLPEKVIVEDDIPGAAVMGKWAGRYYQPEVVYDDLKLDTAGIREVTAHELGHILMGHRLKGKDEDPDPVQEAEADTFGRCYLCPPVLLQAVLPTLEEGIAAAAFGVRRAYFQERLDHLDEDEAAIAPRLQAELLKRAQPWLRSRCCTRCGALWQQTESGRTGCPICGSPAVRWHYEAVSPVKPIRYLNED